MDFFETEDVITDESSHHGIWAEKYRPKDLKNYIADASLKEIMNSFIEKKEICHLLLHGKPGCGKTSLAKILASNIKCDLLYVNASDNTGIDFVRDKIRPFAASTGFNDLKIVILDECEYISLNAQSSLRNLMETFSLNTRFILTCNYVEKIISPLISRCQVFEIEPPSKKDVAVYLKNILDNEKIKYDLLDIKRIVVDFYPDVRKIINYTQQSCLNGEIKHIKVQKSGDDINNYILDQLKDNTKSSFNNIRQHIADSGLRTFDDLYKSIFNNIDILCENKLDIVPDITITIAEYTFQSSMVVDKEITFMACIASLLKLLN